MNRLSRRDLMIAAAGCAVTPLGVRGLSAAAMLWAHLFELLRKRATAAGLMAISPDALIASATAALIDYTVTPRRWE
jgi:hypothetical protein